MLSLTELASRIEQLEDEAVQLKEELIARIQGEGGIFSSSNTRTTHKGGGKSHKGKKYETVTTDMLKDVIGDESLSVEEIKERLKDKYPKVAHIGLNQKLRRYTTSYYNKFRIKD